MQHPLIDKAKAGATQVANLRQHPYADQLRDVRVVGLLVFLLIVLAISWSGVKAIQTNYNLQKDIAQLEQQKQVQQLRNQNLKLQNQYYQIDQYLELEARRNFGLGRAGEKELIVPQDTALASIAQGTAGKAATPSTKQPFYQRNFQAWLNFFLHRQSN